MFGFLWWLAIAFYNLSLRVFQKPLKLADITSYSVNIKRERYKEFLFFRELNIKRLYCNN